MYLKLFLCNNEETQLHDHYNSVMLVLIISARLYNINELHG